LLEGRRKNEGNTLETVSGKVQKDDILVHIQGEAPEAREEGQEKESSNQQINERKQQAEAVELGTGLVRSSSSIGARWQRGVKGKVEEGKTLVLSEEFPEKRSTRKTSGNRTSIF